MRLVSLRDEKTDIEWVVISDAFREEPGMTFTATQRLVCLLALAGAWVGNCRGNAASILVDDFAIAQSIVAFDSVAQISNLDDPRLFSGGRRIFASVDNTISDDDAGVSVEIGGGDLLFSSCENCLGSGTVSWPGAGGGPTIDTSVYEVVEFVVEEITDEVDVRVSLQSTVRPVAFVKDMAVSQPGIYQLMIPRDLDLAGVNVLGLSVDLGRGETVAMSSVKITVPEPLAIVSVALCCGTASCRKRHRQPGVVSR